MVEVIFTIDWYLVIQLILATVMPLLVGLVTTRVTASGTKAMLLAGFTLITSILTGLGDAMLASSTFDLGLALLAALPAFVVSVAMHYGLWKPTGISAAAQDALITKEV